MLKNKTYKVNQDDYKMMKKNDRGKERILYVLDYFPHRIIQHALMIQIEDIMFKNLISTTYSSLPNRGTHATTMKLREDLKNYPSETKFALQMDIRKFYPSVNHEINKSQYRKLFKDNDLLWLLDMIIDSLCLDNEGLKINLGIPILDEDKKGVAIGSLFSQWDGNFNLSGLDHWLKEEKKVKFYYRYCDDLVILGDNKEELHQLRKEIQSYLKINLKLDLKNNYKIYPVDIQGIDFVGYRHFRTYILLRKSIAKRLTRRMRDIQTRMNNGEKLNESDYGAINSYKGWLNHCNGHNLYEKWIKPLEPYHKQYYEEVIKGESSQQCKKHS